LTFPTPMFGPTALGFVPETLMSLLVKLIDGGHASRLHTNTSDLRQNVLLKLNKWWLTVQCSGFFGLLRSIAKPIDKFARQLHDRSAGWWCLQGLSKLMTDLVTRYWQGGLDGDPSAYCHIGLPDLSLDHQRLLLLHLATTTPTGAQDWRYFGKHAVPLVLQSWVKLANY